MDTPEDGLSYLPECPEEPLPSDCCGTGCTPCVMDIYQTELETWRRFAAMSTVERAAQRREAMGHQRRKDPCVKYALSTTQYRSFAVRSIEQVTMSACVYTIALPDGHCLGYLPGQHCTLRALDKCGSMITRHYTPISPPDREGAFDVVIKLYKDGPMSEVIRGWEVGTVTEWKGLFGGISYVPNKYRRLTMLACGTGIAPMVQIMQIILDNEKDETFLTLIYTCPTQHSILLKNLLDQYTDYWNVKIIFVLSKATEEQVKSDPGLVKYRDKVHYGRLDCEIVNKEVPQSSQDSFIFICGTRSFDKDMINHVSKLSYTDSMFHKF